MTKTLNNKQKNVRKGEKWFYKASEIINKKLGADSVYYRGLEQIVSGGSVHLGGVFETVDPNLDLSKFKSSMMHYKNKQCKIMGVTCHQTVGSYRNAIIFHLSN